MGVIIGVDVGGTQIKFGLFSEEYALIKKWSCKTDLAESGRRIIPSAAEEIYRMLEEKGIGREEVYGIGMGIPGPVDSEGYVRNCVNLHWNNFHVVREMKHFFPKAAIAAENDANAAAFGEYYRGAGRAFSSMMLVTLGTGVGGGIVLNGQILSGAHSIAGEIGHVTVYPDEESVCNCGNHGCVDQFASATGIVRYMKKLLAGTEADSMLRGLGKMTAKEICEAADRGDGLAVKCLDKCLGALGIGLGYFSHAFDPEVYVIGGGVSNAGKITIESIEKEYCRHIRLAEKGAVFCIAELGNDAGITGAALLAGQKDGRALWRKELFMTK